MLKNPDAAVKMSSEVYEYTPRQVLEIRGAKLFAAVIVLTSFIATLFQLLAGHSFLTVLPTVSLYAFSVFLSWKIYVRKKNLTSPGFLPHIVAVIVSVIPLVARYIYTVRIDWLYATQCINVYGISLATLIAFQFLYNRKLYIFMIHFVFFNWIIFLVLAWYNGVDMPFYTYTEGRVNYGIMSSRQIYFTCMMIIVAWLSYRNIPAIERFDDLNTEQAGLIKEQAREQAAIAEEVQAQYEELEAQYEEIEQLNEEMNKTQDKLLLANQELAEEKERLVITLGSIDQGVISLNRELVVESANISACYIMKIGPEKAVGKRLSDIIRVVTHEREHFSTQSPEFLNGEHALTLYRSGFLILREGQEKDITLKCTPVSTAAGKLQGYVVVMEDISEFRRLREHMVNASKLDSLGIFAGGIAHDFNNFLTAMIGCITLARNDAGSALSSAGISYLDDAESIAFKARGLTGQLLTFAKGGEPVKKIMSVRKVLEKAPDLVLSGTNIVFKAHIAAGLRDIEADEAQIIQAVSNILLNAIQTMPDGGSVYINAGNILLDSNNYYSVPGGDYVSIEIRDEGEGIPPETACRIFDPFFTTKSEGTGLGLSVVYSIIDRHGGRIVLDSPSEGGACFRIFLPAAAGSADETSGGEKRKFAFTGSVLLMDDDETIRSVSCKLISGLGFEAAGVSSGEEAVDMYRSRLEEGRPFDLVILDLTVRGGMGGSEALAQIRELDPSVKALVSSGYSSSPVMSGYRDYGFSGVLKKPYSVDDLGNAIEKILSES